MRSGASELQRGKRSSGTVRADVQYLVVCPSAEIGQNIISGVPFVMGKSSLSYLRKR